MALSDVAARQAKATGTSYTLADFDGLALAVAGKAARAGTSATSGRKAETDVAGTFPEVTLGEACELRDEARALVAKGINPHLHRKQKRTAVRLADENTFEAVYLKCCSTGAAPWWRGDRPRFRRSHSKIERRHH